MAIAYRQRNLILDPAAAVRYRVVDVVLPSRDGGRPGATEAA